MTSTSANIRYTTVLPAKDVEELKKLAAQKVISSVNNGIREAVEMFLEKAKSDLYAQRMAEAVKDFTFMDRTLETQADFDQVDSEVSGQW
jgi:mevalonate pyrophosphate decarboxylase